MFRMFAKGLSLFSPSGYDLVIITDSDTQKEIAKIRDLKKLTGKVDYLIVNKDVDLHQALLRKFDIFKYDKIMDYEKVMYLDCDIVVQDDLCKMFRSVRTKTGRLYAPAEGTIDGKYWGLDAYRKEDYITLKKKGVKSFNSGTFMFVPDQDMKDHFMAAKRFALSYDRRHFYDQSFFNYYFNMKRLSATQGITRYVQLFPDTTQIYPDKIILHVAGIARYKKKTKMMRDYIALIKSHKDGVTASE